MVPHLSIPTHQVAQACLTLRETRQTRLLAMFRFCHSATQTLGRPRERPDVDEVTRSPGRRIQPRNSGGVNPDQREECASSACVRTTCPLVRRGGVRESDGSLRGASCVIATAIGEDRRGRGVRANGDRDITRGAGLSRSRRREPRPRHHPWCGLRGTLPPARTWMLRWSIAAAS